MYENTSYTDTRYAQKERLARTAFHFSVISLISCFITIVPMLPYFAGVGAVMAAIFSRGRDLRYSSQAKKALIIGIAALVLYTAFIIVNLVLIYRGLQDPAAREEISRIIYQQTGMTLEELLGSYGF